MREEIGYVVKAKRKKKNVYISWKSIDSLLIVIERNSFENGLL